MDSVTVCGRRFQILRQRTKGKSHATGQVLWECHGTEKRQDGRSSNQCISYHHQCILHIMHVFWQSHIASLVISFFYDPPWLYIILHPKSQVLLALSRLFGLWPLVSAFRTGCLVAAASACSPGALAVLAPTASVGAGWWCRAGQCSLGVLGGAGGILTDPKGVGNGKLHIIEIYVSYIFWSLMLIGFFLTCLKLETMLDGNISNSFKTFQQPQ